MEKDIIRHMVDFLISYNNNIAKIGKSKSRITSENNERIVTEEGNYLIDPQSLSFKIKSFDVPGAILTENNNYLIIDNDTFLVWDD